MIEKRPWMWEPTQKELFVGVLRKTFLDNFGKLRGKHFRYFVCRYLAVKNVLFPLKTFPYCEITLKSTISVIRMAATTTFFQNFLVLTFLNHSRLKQQKVEKLILNLFFVYAHTPKVLHVTRAYLFSYVLTLSQNFVAVFLRIL